MAMLTHSEQRELPYSAQQMYDLVGDVARYDEFLPWCAASRINRRDSDEVFYADLVVGYKMIRERFTSKVMLDKGEQGEKVIQIEYLKGPLKHLKNHWRFIPQGNGSCVVDFNVEFEFKNKALQGLTQLFFKEVIHRMVGAFEMRARDIYS